ncbi:MAG TPA: SDR family NAD(P)-dependent oxidoreductase [Candidatus Angelobacter sp.]|nr:SDR family NAD(P)-dependent oxidoreductase [Candidatus Angelobacter sp.]
MFTLSGKTVLVTGGAHRLGKAIALAMAEAGAQIALTFLSSAQEANETLAAIERKGAKGLAVRCDVRQEASVAQAVATVLERFGGLDVLVNNAAIFNSARFEEITSEQWDDIFATNVRGPFLMSKYLVPALRIARGRIIHLGSLGGERPWAAHAHYCSSKAALHMLTRAMANALAPEIAVNCVAPGTIDVKDDKYSPAFMLREAQRTPMGRNGTTQDLAEAVMYFATASSFITGQILLVDGGLGLR